MGEIKIGDKVLVEMSVVGWDKIARDYQMRPEKDTRTFWASEQIVHPMADKAYEDGLREAWEMGKRLYCSTSGAELNEIFGSGWSLNKIMEMTYQHVAQKMKAWDDANKLCEGDVVEIPGDMAEENTLGVVVEMYGETRVRVWIPGTGTMYKGAEEIAKTGRTIDIAGILAQIGGVDDA